MSIAYLDPGNIESDLQSGTVAQYKVIRLHLVKTVHMVIRWGSLVSIMTRLWAGCLGFQFPEGAVMGFLLFANMSRPALRSTQPPIKWIAGSLSLGIKWLGHEADHSFSPSARVKNVWNYTSPPPVRLCGMMSN